MKLVMSEKAGRFAMHYDIFCRAPNTMWTYTLKFDKKKLNWDDNIPDMLEFLSPYADAYKKAKNLTDEQLKDYVGSMLIKTCEDEDDLLILFVID